MSTIGKIGSYLRYLVTRPIQMHLYRHLNTIDGQPVVLSLLTKQNYQSPLNAEYDGHACVNDCPMACAKQCIFVWPVQTMSVNHVDAENNYGLHTGA